MFGPKHPPIEQPTTIFSQLGGALTEGSLVNEAGRAVLRSFQILDPRNSLALDTIGLRIPFEALGASRLHMRAWENEFEQAGFRCTLGQGCFTIFAHNEAHEPITHQRVDRLERLVALMVYQRDDIRLVMPSPEGAPDMQPIPRISFDSVEDWRPYLPREMVGLAESLYGERALFQGDNRVWIRFPSRIPESRRSGDATDMLCRFAERNGLNLKVTEDLRIDLNPRHPTTHDLASCVQLSTDFCSTDRDHRIGAFLEFAHRLLTRCFSADPLWKQQADMVMNGKIPSLLLPPFPLWCTLLPNEVFWRLPLAARLPTPMFDESSGHVSVTLPYRPGREHDEPSRRSNAQATGVTYSTFEVDGATLERFEVQFQRGSRTKSLHGLIKCMNRCFLNTRSPRRDDDRPFGFNFS